MNSSDEIGELRRRRLSEARLYLICEARPGGADPEPLLRAALAGGADIVQLRDKSLGDEAILAAAGTFRRLCDQSGALFVLNDRPDLAVAAGADGVHVGQDDLAVAEARALVGRQILIGLSTHTPEQVRAASGPDYISVGPVFATPTKPGRPATGLELVEFAAANAAPPFFAIGGIDAASAPTVAAAGAERLAAVRAIRDAADPEAAAQVLRSLLRAPAPAAR